MNATNPTSEFRVAGLPPTIQMELGEPAKGQAVLDSPRDFGFHYNGTLYRFRQGRTPLTAELAEVCEHEPYVKDNGAKVVYR